MAEPEIICAGMITVDVLVEGLGPMPRPGETGRVSSITMATGGDALNEATALAKLGNAVGLFGLIGRDAQGDIVRDRCAELGIDTRGLVADPERPTSTGVVLIEETGERSFLAPHGTTFASFGPEHIDLAMIRPGLRALSIGSLFCAPRLDRQALAPLLRKAKAVGAITIADLVMDQRDYGLDALSEAWPYLDYVAPSELEAEIFTGTTDPAGVADAFRKRGVKNVVLKRGARGALAFVGDRQVSCPSFAVPVVDTTGAGDNFLAGLIHGLVRGFGIEEMLRFAAAVAALSVQAVGAGAGLKDLQQVEAFLSS